MRRFIALIALGTLLASASPVSAAGPNDGPSTYGFPGSEQVVAPDSFGGVCTILADIQKRSSTSIGVRGFQDCEGGLIFNQTLELYVDRCDIEFPPGSGNCARWSQFLFLRRCSVGAGGAFWCPLTSNFLVVNGVGQGQYKARAMGTVSSNIGNGNGSDESPSVYLP